MLLVPDYCEICALIVKIAVAQATEITTAIDGILEVCDKHRRIYDVGASDDL